LQKVLETAQSRPESLEGIRFREKLTHFLLLIIRIIFENLKKGSETGSHHNDSSSTAEVLKEELENEQLLMNRLICNGICLPKNTIIFIQDLFGSKFVRLGWSQV